ncbi:hypothetical protein FRC11_006419 [Ceratobasidium sp. 423]|nr:hypothetical protein FRC11_006419 [Ceratobasidium sp. 423]
MRRFSNIFSVPPTLPDAFGIGPTYDWSASIDRTSTPEDRTPSLEHRRWAISAETGDHAVRPCSRLRTSSITYQQHSVLTHPRFQVGPIAPAANSGLPLPVADPLFDWSTVQSPTPSLSDFSAVIPGPPAALVERPLLIPSSTTPQSIPHVSSLPGGLAPVHVGDSLKPSQNQQTSLPLATSNTPNAPSLAPNQAHTLATPPDTHSAQAAPGTTPAPTFAPPGHPYSPATSVGNTSSVWFTPSTTPVAIAAPTPRLVAPAALLNHANHEASVTSATKPNFGIFGPPNGLLTSSLALAPGSESTTTPNNCLPVSSTVPNLDTPSSLTTPTGSPPSAPADSILACAYTPARMPSLAPPPAPRPAHALPYALSSPHPLVSNVERIRTPALAHTAPHNLVPALGPSCAPAPVAPLLGTCPVYTPATAYATSPAPVPSPGQNCPPAQAMSPPPALSLATGFAHTPSPSVLLVAPTANVPPTRPLFKENSEAADKLSSGSATTGNDGKKRKTPPCNETPSSHRRRTEVGVITVSDSESDSSDLDAEIARAYGIELKDTGFQGAAAPVASNSKATKSLRNKKQAHYGTKWTGGPGGALKFNAKPEGFVEGVDRWSYSENTPKSALITERLEGDVHFCPIADYLPEEEPFKSWVCVSGPDGLLRWVEFSAGQPHPRYRGFVFKPAELPRKSP